MTLHALVTRPEADAAPVAEALRARGFTVTVEPMLTIRPLPEGSFDPKGDLEGVQALLFTSANGVRAFAAQAAERGLPVLTVGNATAEAAEVAGFDRVESAGGDVHSLADLVRARLDPAEGPLLHVAGSVVAGDLAGLLAGDGFRVRRSVLYEAVPADRLSPATAEALAEGAFDLVLFFSSRTAETFARLVRHPAGETTATESLDREPAERLVAGCAQAEAICLSQVVAEAAARRLPWRRVRTADRPDLPAMLDLIDAVAAERKTTTDSRMDRDMDETAQRKHAPAPDAPAPEAAESADARASSAPPKTAMAGSGADNAETAELRASGEPESREPGSPEPTPHDAEWDAEPERSEAPATEPGATEQGPWAGPDGPAPLPAQRRGGAGLVALAAVVAAAVTLALVLTQPWWSPRLGLQTAPEPAVAQAPPPAAGTEVAERLAEMERRLGALAGRLDESDRTLAALADSFAGLREKMAAGGTDKPAALPPEVAAAPGRLDALEQRIADLAARANRPVEPPPEMRAALEDLQSGLGQVRTDLGELRTDLADLERELGDVPRLRQRTAAQEAVAARSAEKAALMLAAAQLRASLATDRPFTTELAALRELADDEPGFAETIEPLAARAESGIPTLRDLQAAFPDVARAVVQAEQSATLGGAAPEAGGDGPGWLDRTLARLSSLVTIRPVGGTAEGATPGARVARAEADLAASDLQGAVDELSGLSGAAARKAEDWLERARARLAADAAAEKLQTAVLRALAQGGGSSGGAAAGPDPATAPTGAAPLAGG